MSDELVTLKRQLTGLNRLHQLQKQLRLAQSQTEIGYTMVNDTKQLVNYRQAFWWQPKRGITHASGLAQVEAGTPFVRWANALCEHKAKDTGSSLSPDPLTLTAADFPEDIAKQWHEFLPAHLLLVPIIDQGNKQLMGFLAIARDNLWIDAELGLIGEIADIYRFSLQGQRRGAKNAPSRYRRHILWGGIGAAVILASLPVRISVLAPAEVIARDAVPVRAPYAGVVDALHVKPNQRVEEGDLLVSLDDTDLSNRIVIAEQELQIARTEYRQVAQKAVFDEQGKLELAIRRGMVEKTSSELSYLQSLLSRTRVHAQSDGIVVLSDANEWIGRPVVLGEQILTVADPAHAELKFDLAVGDAIELERGASIKFFMNISPDQPLPASLAWLAFKAEQNEAGSLSYAGRADFIQESGEEPPRIGLRGTARIYGDRAPLIYYVMRRPMAALRQWIGFY